MKRPWRDEGETSMRRHYHRHLPATLVSAQAVAEIARADDLLAQARRLQDEATEVLAAAKAQGNRGGVLQAVDRLQRGLALCSQLAERLGPAEDRTLTICWRDVCKTCGVALE